LLPTGLPRGLLAGAARTAAGSPQPDAQAQCRRGPVRARPAATEWRRQPGLPGWTMWQSEPHSSAAWRCPLAPPKF